MIFRQLFESISSTYTYLLADENTREGLLIDPVKETLERDLQFIQELKINLLYVLDTHVHADHITSSGKIKNLTGAKIVVSQASGVASADVLLKDNEELAFGAQKIKGIYTPGHTDTCMSFYSNNMLFTGDTLLIRGCGRTDFQSGSAETLYDSVHNKLFSLPGSTKIYPAHDYKGRTSSTIDEEKAHNPRLKVTNTKEQFVDIMNNLKLAPPKKIEIAVPANLKSGL